MVGMENGSSDTTVKTGLPKCVTPYTVGKSHKM
jgi:hypothetical protein